jgi:hypothetical protein
MIRDAAQEQHNRFGILIQQLGSPGFRKREDAEAELRASGAMAGSFLVDALGSGSHEVVRRATRLLNGLGDQAIPHLVHGLASPQEHTRIEAFNMLRAMGPRAVPGLLRGLGNEGEMAQPAISTLLRLRVNDIATSTKVGEQSLDRVAASQARGLTPRPRTQQEMREHRQAASDQLAAIDAWMQNPANAPQIAELQRIARAGEAGGPGADAARELINLPQRARLNLALLCAQELTERWDQLTVPEREELPRQAAIALTQALRQDRGLIQNPEFLAAMRFTGCGMQPVPFRPGMAPAAEAPQEVRTLREWFVRMGGNNDDIWEAPAPWRRR